MHTSQINAVEQTLENIKTERPVYAEMVDLFGPLFALNPGWQKSSLPTYRCPVWTPAS